MPGDPGLFSTSTSLAVGGRRRYPPIGWGCAPIGGYGVWAGAPRVGGVKPAPAEARPPAPSSARSWARSWARTRVRSLVPDGAWPVALLRPAGTAVAVVVTFFWSLLSLTTAGMPDPDAMGLREMLVVCVGLGATVGVSTVVVWRREYPVVLCVLTSVLGIVLLLGPMAPLLVLPWVLARADVRRCLWCVALTAATVAVSLRRDAVLTSDRAIFTSTPTADGVVSVLSVGGYWVVGVLVLGLAVAVGLARRFATSSSAARLAAAREAHRASALQQTAVHLQDEAAHLRTDLTRQDEREAIAREVHDTVAHHLSLVSLHASALEVCSPDPEVGDAARSMRSSAHRALEEMRTLISSLRAGGDDYPGAAPSLAELPRLLADARAAGVDVTSTVFVSDAERASPALTRAVYRIMQESLTNVLKHTSGVRAEVEVTARPGAGVDVTVTNPVGAGGPGPGLPSGGAGIVGMRERAEALGGTFSAALEGERFVVRAHLPWAASPVAGAPVEAVPS